jgi:hypothetical protein
MADGFSSYLAPALTMFVRTFAGMGFSDIKVDIHALLSDTIVIMYVYVRVLPAIGTFHYLFVRHENMS